MRAITAPDDAKIAIFMRGIHHDGIEPYPGSVRYLQAARSASLHTAVVSSSANCAGVLDIAEIGGLFQTRIDGVSAAGQHLVGKPAPATYPTAATVRGVEPGEAAVRYAEAGYGYPASPPTPTSAAPARHGGGCDFPPRQGGDTSTQSRG